MDVDPELIGLLAVAEGRIEACLRHRDLTGANAQAVRGACNAVAFTRKRLVGDESVAEVRVLHGIERSLPAGDLE